MKRVVRWNCGNGFFNKEKSFPSFMALSFPNMIRFSAMLALIVRMTSVYVKKKNTYFINKRKEKRNGRIFNCE